MYSSFSADPSGIDNDLDEGESTDSPDRTGITVKGGDSVLMALMFIVLYVCSEDHPVPDLLDCKETTGLSSCN